MDSYLSIKKDIQEIASVEMERMLDTPDLSILIIQKK